MAHTERYPPESPTSGAPAPGGASAGARWITGVGAFLLLAAAGAFVAVRWDQIPDQAKFAALVALTAGCLGGDNRLRRDLPITATALLHTGVLLVPFDVAAVGVWRGWAWPEMLLSQGLTVTVACGVAGHRRDSIVLRTIAWLGVIPLTGGIAASFGVPAGPVLAATALGGALTGVSLPPAATRRHRELQVATGSWATLAALSTPLALMGNLGLPAFGVLRDLGLVAASPPVAGLTALLGGAALLVLAARTQHRVPIWLSGTALAWGPVLGLDEPVASLAFATAGALGLAGVAASVPGAATSLRAATAVRLLGWLALAPLGTGTFVLAARGAPALSFAGAIAGCWLLAAILDRAPVPAVRPPSVPAGPRQGDRQVPLGMVPRGAALLPLAATPLLGTSVIVAGEVLAIAGLFGTLALVDAVRLDRPALLTGTGVATPLAVASLVLAPGGDLAAASVGVALSAVVWLGLGACLPARWLRPALVSSGLAATAGLLMSGEAGWSLDANLLILGVAGLVAGMTLPRFDVMAAGAASVALGTFRQLDHHDVTAIDAYAAPLALLVLVAGLHARRTWSRPVSSWIAYAPAIILLGGAGLVERLTGGAGWHALVAGGVAFTALTAGATARLAGPLFTGTALVVAVTVHETLGTTSQAPTWLWLAAGGAALLTVGVMMERRGTGPLESGRRLVDLVGERFT